MDERRSEREEPDGDAGGSECAAGGAVFYGGGYWGVDAVLRGGAGIPEDQGVDQRGEAGVVLARDWGSGADAAGIPRGFGGRANATRESGRGRVGVLPV